MYIMKQHIVDVDKDDEISFVPARVTVEDITVDDHGRIVGIWKENVDGKVVSHRVTHYKFYANTWQFI